MSYYLPYPKNEINYDILLGKLAKKHPDFKESDFYDYCDTSLVADRKDCLDFPRFYEFQNVDGSTYVVAVHNRAVTDIYTVPNEISDYEYPCQEVFLATVADWAGDKTPYMMELYGANEWN